MATSHLKRRTNPITRANRKKGGKGNRDVREGHKASSAFPTGTGLDEMPVIEPRIQQCQSERYRPHWREF